MYATAAERMLKAIGEPQMVNTAEDSRLGRIFMNRTIKVYPAFSDFYGLEETIERIVGYFRHAAQGLEERKQILYLLGPVGGGKSSLAERLKDLMEQCPIYVLRAGQDTSPIFESPLGLFNPETMGTHLEDKYGIPERALTGYISPWAVKRLDEFGGDICQVLGREAISLEAAPDLRRQDRARRREQPGHLGPRRQGRHPQARALRPERRRRLLLLGRPQPHDAGPARVRRDVQGAAQDAASAADGDAGSHLRRHRERRRDALPGHHRRALERERVAELPRQPHQRGVPRPYLRHQGALLPAGGRGEEDLREAAAAQRAGRGAMRARHARDAGAVLGPVAPQGA